MTQPIHGIPASPGFAEGKAYCLAAGEVQVVKRTGCQPEEELARLESALRQVRQALEQDAARARTSVGASEAEIFEAHSLILEDPDLREQVRAEVEGERVNIEFAWQNNIDRYAKILEGMDNELFAARAADVRDVGKRVLWTLTGTKIDTLAGLTSPSVILARDLTPSDTIAMDKSLVLAFCTAEGGPTSHTAILAKALGIPAVVGLGAAILDIAPGSLLCVDGVNGRVLVNPDPSARAAFESARSAFHDRSKEELSHAHEPAVSLDGVHFEIVANIGGEKDAQKAVEMGAEGVGLFRTEFVYLDRAVEPDEEEQYRVYQSVMEIMGTRPVVVRTLDIGGDKDIPYLHLEKEANPFLGVRAIRLCLQQPEMFLAQLRALLRAAVGHDLRIMFPMVATLSEVRTAREYTEKARAELAARGIAVPKVQLGIMVEIPSTAVLADQFAREVDFFSIGTNDLTQYTFAAERVSEKMAYLSDPLHPAVLRLVQRVIEEGHKQGIWIGMCGELAGDADAVPILMGLGLDEFSMSPNAVPHAKAVIRQWSTAAARELAVRALDLESGEDVRALVRSTPPR